MKIDRAEVEHVAYLARIHVPEEDLALRTEQLNSILTYLDKLAELETTGIEPMAHAVALATPFREDEVRPSLDPELALQNAPRRDRTFFTVPRVI